MEALGINIGYLIMQILGVTVLVLLLTGLLYNPITRVLEERKERIAKGLEDARQAAVARDNADIEAKKILEAARQEAARSRQEAVAQADETRKGIIAQAETDARRIVAQAREDAEEERNRILADLRSQVAAIAVAAANKLIGETLDEERQRALIADFFARVPTGIASLNGDTAEVVSALPLTEAEKANIQRALNVAHVDFRVEPRILGGLIVRVGDQIIDNSVAAQMNALRTSLS